MLLPRDDGRRARRAPAQQGGRMTVDIQKLFNQDIPASMAANPDAAKAIGATYQINIGGEGEWFIDASSTGPFCTSDLRAADCTITVAAEDFQKLAENPQANGMQLFFAGKLKVSGNPLLAQKLGQLLGLAR
jgi:putative sterol carrier protein